MGRGVVGGGGVLGASLKRGNKIWKTILKKFEKFMVNILKSSRTQMGPYFEDWQDIWTAKFWAKIIKICRNCLKLPKFLAREK